jgi:pyruvate-formate lyase-activating enzyme
MDRLHKVYDRFFTPIKLLPAGVFNTQEFDNNNKPYRLHLRMEKDGTGILIVNARTVLHLNTTAAEYAYYRIQKTPVEVIADTLSKRYRISRDEAQKDFLAFCDQINNFLNSQDLDPETSFGFERREPYSTELSAPMRLDCALTYHLTIKVPPGVTPVDRVTRELSTEEWKTILSKAWDAGVPHVIFTGGEPTLRPDLIDLIAHAEELGQVSGVITNGFRLSEKDYLHALLEAGLDHFMILFDPNEEQAWEALRDVLAEEIHTTVHLTITPELSIGVRSLLERLKGMGVHTISLSAISKEFQDSLNIAKQAAADLNITLVWDLPVPYSNFHPIAMEMAENEPIPSGAGKAWLYVEPDGDVLKAQGVLPVLGNLLTDSWDYIWKHT